MWTFRVQFFLVVILRDYCVICPSLEYSQYDNTAPFQARAKPCTHAKFRAKKGDGNKSSRAKIKRLIR